MDPSLQFDRMARQVNQIMNSFAGGLGGGMSGFGGGMGGFGGGLSDIDMFDMPLLGAGGVGGGWQEPGLLTSGIGGKGQEEQKTAMDTSGGGGQLTTTGQPRDLQVGLKGAPLRCRVNVEDTDKAYIVTAEVPSFDKENLKVSIDNNILTIEGEQKHEHREESKDKKYLRAERSFANVRRSLRMPPNIKPEEIHAEYVNGILHVNVPKTEQKETKQSVQIA